MGLFSFFETSEKEPIPATISSHGLAPISFPKFVADLLKYRLGDNKVLLLYRVSRNGWLGLVKVYQLALLNHERLELSFVTHDLKMIRGLIAAAVVYQLLLGYDKPNVAICLQDVKSVAPKYLKAPITQDQEKAITDEIKWLSRSGRSNVQKTLLNNLSHLGF